RARPVWCRGADGVVGPLVSDSVGSDIHAKTQGPAGAVLGDGWRQQPRLDVWLPNPGDLLDRHVTDRPDRLRERRQPADRTGPGPPARDRTAAVAWRIATPCRPESDRRGTCAFDRFVDGRLLVRVVGLSGDRDIFDPVRRAGP